MTSANFPKCYKISPASTSHSLIWSSINYSRLYNNSEEIHWKENCGTMFQYEFRIFDLLILILELNVRNIQPP